jgi:tetraacyldisaccharide 4'-kinase
MHWYGFLLYPFALLYNLVTQLRNWFYDQGWFKTTESPFPTILVGNLSVGGTGKTPMVEYLIRLLKDELKLGTLSRGYGRSSKGFIKAIKVSNPQLIGDEPFQIYKKFGNEIQVFVGEDRVNALKKIKEEIDCPQVMILDDAFQHRLVKAHLNILLTTFQQPFFSDHLLPAGRLRESRSGSKRADLVVVTKCPYTMTEGLRNEFKDQISQYTGSKKPVLFSHITYGKPYPIEDISKFSTSIILLSGLANDELLVKYCRNNFDVIEILSFPDHHDYSESDFAKLKKARQNFPNREVVILTTEKDAAKVKSTAPEGFMREIPIFVLPILVGFSSEDAEILMQQIQQKVLKKTKTSEI